MKRQLVRHGVALALLIFAGSALANAQPATMQISFGFIVAGKIMKSGTYAVDVAANGNVSLTPEAGAAMEVPRLKTLTRNVQKAELVFDRVGEVYYLSEVWLPGKGGRVVGDVDGSQGRRVVTARNVDK